MRTSNFLLSSVSMMALSGCIDQGVGTTSGALGGSSSLGGSPSDQGVQPEGFPGNFVASDDDQICYELSQLGGWGIAEEMKGFKIDPPTSVTNGAGTFSVTQPYLAWEAAPDVRVLAVIVKGGPSYNLYDYFATDFTSDGHLHSPVFKKKLPDISHYNVCYEPAPPAGDQGCTPGYWRNHADRWAGAASSEHYDATFGITSAMGGAYTLAQAIWATGGGELALARHATAGLLNSIGGVPNADGTTVAYPYTTQQVKQLVQAAYATADDPLTGADERAAAIEAAKDQLAAANELGCPLGGTSAVPVE